MADKPRRQFLKTSAGIVSGLTLGVCAQDVPAADNDGQQFDRDVLDALGDIVLPRTALGDAGIVRVIGEFVAWLDAFEPVTERDHPYYSPEINYGPPHPGPLWGAQLDALNIEAQQRFETEFPALGEDQRRYILDRQLPTNIPQDLPYAGNAPHVAIGLLSWFYATPEANDLALQAKIGRQSCRGLQSSPDKPAPSGS
jgi:hypothetical protein